MNASEIEFIEARLPVALQAMPSPEQMDQLLARAKRERSEHLAGAFAAFVEGVNGGNQTVPTLLYPDGTAENDGLNRLVLGAGLGNKALGAMVGLNVPVTRTNTFGRLPAVVARAVVRVNSSILARVPGPALLLAIEATISP